MLANYLIGLREGLEAALVVSILVAYLVKTERRHLLPRIWLGVAVAIALSVAVTLGLGLQSRKFTFETQELIGGTLSLVAVAFVTWMIFWMAGAARTIGSELRGRIDVAADGRAWSLVVVAFLAVGREGLETALILWTNTQAAIGRDLAPTAQQTAEPLIAALAGILTAVVLGYLIYRGAISINLTRFFTWTGAFLIVVAAGVLAYGVHDLQEAGFLPGLHTLAFDVSHIIAPGSWYGTLLKGVFNFSPATTVLEAIAWVAYVVPVSYLFFRMTRRRTAASSRPTSVPEGSNL
ncbi:iron uptake transporter permease EfeU [Nocardioides sp. cx-173]|uniref:iron uptake transporter permease EfeU n=1 Tax=Nocardioides sp. cx-173 TaxID=2898796 RepID=UPI001E4252E4|nr:iron uptake transporter permease EfeU [Nocardioides sp. cx-173]MCD4524351.1 FTR1 family protein [Nocardioides sp. cx-173]UGB43161.1 FTR1 family protein [Nocardioides sp. cx-173]